MNRFVFIVIAYTLLATGKAQQVSSLLPIVENGKWGFINRSGTIKIAPSFDQVGTFEGALATVQNGELFYLIDTTGMLVFKEGFSDISILSNEFVAIKNGNFALADKYGRIFSPFSYSFISDYKLNTLLLKSDTTSYDLFNKSRKVLRIEKYNRVEVHLEAAYIDVKKNNKVGILDSLHHTVLALVEGEKALMDKGVSIVKTKEGFKIYKDSIHTCGDTLLWKNYRVLSKKYVEVWNHPARKFIIVTSTGKQFPFSNFTSCELFESSFLLVLKGAKKGLLDEQGQVVLPLDHDKIEQASDTTIRFSKGKKVGVVSIEGKLIFPCQFDWIDKFDEYGIALAMNDSLYGIVNKKGIILVPCHYDNIEITTESWKCFRRKSMDLYNLKNPYTIDELLHFNTVGSVSIKKITRRNFEFTNLIEAAPAVARKIIKTKEGNYRYNFVKHTYSIKSKMKCLRVQSFLNVSNLYGAFSYIENRVIATTKYWDISLEELEVQEFARIILVGDWQGLLGRKGQLKTTFPLTKNGKIAPTPITYIGPFVNGLARINLGGTYCKGNDIKDPNRATFPASGLSCINGKWGFLNGNGEVVVPIEFEYASDFFRGRAIVKTKGKYGVIDTLNSYIIKPEYDLISYLEKSDYRYFVLVKNKTEKGILNDKGRVILQAQFEDLQRQNCNRIPVKEGGLWGACDFTGHLVLPCSYDFITPFEEGKAAFKVKNKWGFIDSMGTILVPPIYTEVGNFCDGFAKVKEKTKWGFIDSIGKLVIPYRYSKTSSFQDGVASVYLNKKWFFIDKKGARISRHSFTKITDFDENGLAIVRKKKKYLVFRKIDQKILSTGNYKFIAPYKEGMARVKTKQNKWGFMDDRGKLAIDPIYTGAGDFSEGLVRVREQSGKWGFIDRNGKLKIAPEYRLVSDFSEGKVTVSTGTSTIVQDSFGIKLFEVPEKTLGKYKEGLLLLNGTYYNQQGKKEMGPFGFATPFKNGLAKVHYSKGREIGNHLINRKNASIAYYPYIGEVDQKIACFSIFSRIGLADSNGKMLFVPTYQKVIYLGDGIFQVRHFDAVGYMRNDGTWLWKPSR